MKTSRVVRALFAGAAALGAITACTLARPLDYLTSAGDAGGQEVEREGGSSGEIDGEAPRDAVADAQLAPRNLTQDSDNLYWSNADGVIMTVAKAGGPTRAVATAPAGAAVAWLTADSDPQGDLFLIAGDAVHRVPKAGGDLTLIEKDTPRPRALAVDDDALFVAHSDESSSSFGHLARFSKDGTSRAFLSVDGDEPVAVALHGDSVFWAGLSEDGSGVVFELPKNAPPDAGASAKVHKGPGVDDEVYPDTAEGFAVDDEAIYFLELDDVYRLARGQALVPATLFDAPEGAKPASFAYDGQSVYIADQRDKGAVIRVAKTGGAPTVVASNQPVPTSVVVDATSVYFTVQGTGLSPDGAVLRVRK